MAKREPKLLRLRVAAHELGLHPITVRRWIKAGRIQVVLSDIGSGLKASRRQLQRLLKLVCEGKVGEVAITRRGTGSPASGKSMSRPSSPVSGSRSPFWSQEKRNP